jgi:hypothetical protein
VKAELEQYGIKMEAPFQLEFDKGPIVELEAEDVTDADDADSTGK